MSVRRAQFGIRPLSPGLNPVQSTPAHHRPPHAIMKLSDDCPIHPPSMRDGYRSIAIVGLLLALLAQPALAASSGVYRYGAHAGVTEFIDMMVTSHGFDRQRLIDLFVAVKRKPKIIELMDRPYESKPWHQYRKRFLQERRISRGASFWRRNATLVDRVADAYGVAPEIMIAILAVETDFGGFLGRDRVIDALATLGFDYPRRSAFFTRELEQFMLMSRELDIDPLKPIGSYAGAMGMPQFMPSSFRNFAVDFDKDGDRDLWESLDDVLGSVAHYFRRHGWRRDGAVTLPARVSGDRYQQIIDNRTLKPELTLQELRLYGVQFDSWLDPTSEKAILLELDGARGKEYWLGLHNFYVISRYNRSAHYAMAVHQLSERIRDRYLAGQ